MRWRSLALLGIGLAAIAIRCWHIDAPFIDPWSWRQCDVAAIARNYFENGYHFVWPQIDWAGDRPGFVGTEFPILPFVAAIAYKFVGVHEWVGRAETILFFATSLPLFFAIVWRAFDQTSAFFAFIFYAFAPLTIAAGRAFMPDIPSLTFALAALYFFCRWIEATRASVPLAIDVRTRSQSSVAEERRNYNYAGGAIFRGADDNPWLDRVLPYRNPASALIAATIALALCLLLKPTNATIGAPLALLAWRKFRGGVSTQGQLLLFAVIALLPSLIWYWHAQRIAGEFYPYHFFGAGGVGIMNPGWYWRIFLRTFFTSLTPVLFSLACLGFVLAGRRKWLLGSWLAATLLGIVVVGYGNRHEWYRLPLVPIAAAFAGHALKLLWDRRVTVTAVLLMLFLVNSALVARSYFNFSATSLWQLGLELNKITAPNALIVAADDGDPTALYYAHRRGWHFLERDGLYNGNPLNSAQIMDDLRLLRERGATHLVFYDGTMWWLEYYREFAQQLQNETRLISASTQYRIYQLNRSK